MSSGQAVGNTGPAAAALPGELVLRMFSISVQRLQSMQEGQMGPGCRSLFRQGEGGVLGIGTQRAGYAPSCKVSP